MTKSLLAFCALLVAGTPVQAQPDALASWNESPVKQEVIHFVRATTTKSSSEFVPPDERLATFDQDGIFSFQQPAGR